MDDFAEILEVLPNKSMSRTGYGVFFVVDYADGKSFAYTCTDAFCAFLEMRRLYGFGISYLATFGLNVRGNYSKVFVKWYVEYVM